MAAQSLSPFSPGHRAPFLYGVVTDWSFYSFQGQAGRPVALILARSINSPGVLSLIEAFSALSAEFAALSADAVLVARDEPEALFNHAAANPAPVIMVACQAPNFFAECGFDRDEPLVVILNRGMRIVDLIDTGDPQTAVANSLAVLAGLVAEEPRDILMPAPALMIHNLIDRAFCKALIAKFENGKTFDSGMAGADGNKIDHTKKQRRDCNLDPGEELYDEVMEVLLKRCAPEMKAAFQADITHADRILIARYDVGGQFKRHVDNATPAVAFRQFALSLNLNAEDYDGGYLLFPEFNAHHYSPPTGAGLIFSSSVLHEATPVTRGHRYVLLTFLHNKEAEMRRLGLA